MSSSGERRFVQELLMCAACAALSYVVLVVGLNQLNPNRDAAKKSLERKKEIANRLGFLIKATTGHSFSFISVARGKLLGPQKGVLLYGPPGTGKTMLAKAIAKESGAVFVNVRVSNLMSKWFGDAEKLVSAVFSLAHKLQPAIIFIDEVDSFLGQRESSDHDAVTNMKTEFMALWDGFSTDQHAQVMVLAATNRPSDLDEAILRRLPQSFEIGLPNRKDGVAILKVALKDEKVGDGSDFDHIAGLCVGYTGSDLIELCKKAAYFPIRDLLDNEKEGKLTREEPRPLYQSDLEGVVARSTKTSVAAVEFKLGLGATKRLG